MNQFTESSHHEWYTFFKYFTVQKLERVKSIFTSTTRYCNRTMLYLWCTFKFRRQPLCLLKKLLTLYAIDIQSDLCAIQQPILQKFGGEYTYSLTRTVFMMTSMTAIASFWMKQNVSWFCGITTAKVTIYLLRNEWKQIKDWM